MWEGQGAGPGHHFLNSCYTPCPSSPRARPQAPGAASREAGWRLFVKGRWARASTLHGLDHHSFATAFTGHRGVQAPKRERRDSRDGAQHSVSLPQEHSVGLQGTCVIVTFVTPALRGHCRVHNYSPARCWSAHPGSSPCSPRGHPAFPLRGLGP